MTKPDFTGYADDYKDVIAFALTRALPELGVMEVRSASRAVFFKLMDLGLITVKPDPPPL